MKLPDFLSAISAALPPGNGPIVLLRNHERLPESTSGSDIDVLVPRRAIGEVIAKLQSSPAITLTAMAARNHVVMTCWHGVEHDAVKAVEVDFVFSLTWKGLAYLDSAEVIARSRARDGLPHNVNVPDDVDEAIISVLSGWLASGAVKARYAERAREVFIRKPTEAVARLEPAFGRRAASALIRRIASSRELPAVTLYRSKLLLRHLTQSPRRSAAHLFGHFAQEARIARNEDARVVVSFLGPDGAGKSTLINALNEDLKQAITSIEVKKLKPTFFLRKRIADRGVVTEPHAKRPRSALVCYAKLGTWLGELWLERFLWWRKQPTLQIYDRYLYDVLVDPWRYRIPIELSIPDVLIAAAPAPDLTVVVTAPVDTIRNRKQEVSEAETARQVNGYRALPSIVPNAVEIDSNRPVAEMLTDLRRHVLATLAKKAATELGWVGEGSHPE